MISETRWAHPYRVGGNPGEFSVGFFGVAPAPFCVGEESWQRAWRAEVQVEIDADMVEKKLEEETRRRTRRKRIASRGGGGGGKML